MKARVNRIIQYAGQEYRLEARLTAPPMPDVLREILVKNGYLEELPPKPAQKLSSRKPKEG